MLLGSAAWGLLNYWLTSWMLPAGFDAADSVLRIEGYTRYAWTMVILVFVELPLASAFTTVYLGQALFVDRPRMRDVVWQVLSLVPRLIWCQVLLRGVLVALILVFAIARAPSFSSMEVYLIFLFFGLLVWRATAPFLNEIVLLERNPLRATAPGAMTIHKRSLMMHGPVTSSLISLALVVYLAGILLTGLVWGTMVLLQGIFILPGVSFESLDIGPGLMLFGLPLALWITAMYLTVVRFLSYLDLRIRYEGWEVELRMRAEANRMAEASP